GNALSNYLVGNAGDNILNGMAGGDDLYGGAGNDILNGGTGNDRLLGDAGADTMAGGAGNDTYTVDDAGDIVTENLNEGDDRVPSSVSFTLGANIEDLVLGGAADIDGTRNALKDGWLHWTKDGELAGDSNILRFGAGITQDMLQVRFDNATRNVPLDL